MKYLGYRLLVLQCASMGFKMAETQVPYVPTLPLTSSSLGMEFSEMG